MSLLWESCKFLCLLLLLADCSQDRLDYKNPSAPTDVRVKDLLSRMTPEEKFWQLYMIPGDLNLSDSNAYSNGIFGLQVRDDSLDAIGLLKKTNGIQRYFVERTRLGIPVIFFEEALHGVLQQEATMYPQAIGLAATFDTTLMRQVSTAIARETRARGIRQVLSPVVNIATDVRWGRVEETYGEDTHLTTELGVVFVNSFERLGVITTPKHFIANVGEGGRDSYPIHLTERFLEEIHFPPFREAIERGGARSVMTSYNSYDGTPTSASSWLMTDKLKKEMGFTGFIISDASAVGGSIVLHRTAKDYPVSAEQALEAGLDVIFQTSYEQHKLFIPPFLDGRIDQDRIDDAVSRVLRVKFELGLFENPYVSEDTLHKIVGDRALKALARRATEESIVMLKNEESVLPISDEVGTIAVIGLDAVEARLGGYSGPGNKKVSILDGIKARVARSKVVFAPGCGRSKVDWVVVDSIHLSTTEGKRGLTGEYFNNIDFRGVPDLKRADRTVNFQWTLSGPARGINKRFFSARWSGRIISPTSGNYKIGLDGNDGYRLFIGDKLMIDRWNKTSYATQLADFRFEKGVAYDIRVEFFEPVGNSRIKLIWNVGVVNETEARIREAVQAAATTDVSIVCVGINEGEFQDRSLLSLPGEQESMIRRVAAVGKPLIVVLVGGSAVTMSNWINDADAIIDVWYPGEEGGHAVASVLFGDYNPAGRLPITFPQHEGQLPLVYNHKPTGRGDDYINLSGLPLFPFGFGLSYTRFEYTNIRLDKDSIRAGESTFLHVDVTNTGAVAGEEVVQLYINDPLSSIARSVMELKGFTRFHLNPGEKKEVRFLISPESLIMLDEKMRWIVEPGDFNLMVGASSRDIRGRAVLRVK